MWIADPKTINHILKNSVTRYKKMNSTREMAALILDRGLAWAEGNAFLNSVSPRILTPIGDAHKRQRRAMAPAFGLVEAKGLSPYFAQSAAKVGGRLTSVQHCDRSTLPAAGRQMARVDHRRGLGRIFGHRCAFMDQQSGSRCVRRNSIIFHTALLTSMPTGLEVVLLNMSLAHWKIRTTC